MTKRTYRRFAIILLLLATALHLYESLVLADKPSTGWFVWGTMPYSWCVLALLTRGDARPPMAGGFIGLTADLLVHYDVFIHPTSSTAALGMLFIPLWNALILIPLPLLASAWILAEKER